MDEDLRAHIDGARQYVKATQRNLRGLLQYLTDLEERLDAQPEEAQRNGRNKHPSRDEEVRLVKH